MSTTEEIRQWWAAWECDTDKYVRHAFPGDGRVWNLWVADQSLAAWILFTEVMVKHDYLFISPAGGTYNCRNIGGTNKRSLHAYAVAVDLNPDKNPYGKPLRHDYPPEFIADIEAITFGGKKAFQWGGEWNTPDAMHWQIDLAPEEIMSEGPNGEPRWDEVSDWAKNSWTWAWEKNIITVNSVPKDLPTIEQLMVFLNRAK